MVSRLHPRFCGFVIRRLSVLEMQERLIVLVMRNRRIIPAAQSSPGREWRWLFSTLKVTDIYLINYIILTKPFQSTEINAMEF